MLNTAIQPRLGEEAIFNVGNCAGWAARIVALQNNYEWPNVLMVKGRRI